MKYILLISFIATLVSCQTKKQKPEDRNNYFEGTIELNITFASRYPEVINNLKKTFGTKEIDYVGENGYFGREYIDSNNIILRKEIFRPDSLRFYSYSINSDTVFYIEGKESTGSNIIKITKNSSYKILNHTVDRIELRAPQGNIGDTTFYIYTTYYNDVNYFINPLAYKHILADNVEDIFSASPHITTGTVFQFGNLAAVTCTASRIIPSSVPDWRFDIPKNKILAKQSD